LGETRDNPKKLVKTTPKGKEGVGKKKGKGGKKAITGRKKKDEAFHITGPTEENPSKGMKKKRGRA